MGGVVSVACQGFMVREACVDIPVGGVGFLLCPVISYEMPVVLE